MDAILTAGGIPLPEDPLYTHTKGNSKAMLDIAGKPMIQWVLDALGAAKNVDNVILIGLSEKSGVTCQKPIHYIPNQGRMLSNIIAGIDKSLELDPENKYVLLASSDLPGINGEMVDWLAEQVKVDPSDLYYGVIPRDVMEKRYPNSRRTFTRLKDVELCGADLHACHVSVAADHLETWEKLIGHRKSPLQQASIIGFWTLFLLLTRQLTLQDAVIRASQSIGIKGKAIVWPWAEAGMDVDKPHQLEIMRQDLAR